MAFGAIEEPDGIVAPIRRHEDLIVFGFEDVFKRAGAITLPSGPRIRIPQTAGYAVNSFSNSDLYSNVDNYRPRYINVTFPLSR